MNWLDTLREKYGDDRFFKEVFETQIYKEAFDLGQVDTVLDIGACAGEFSFYMYDHAQRIYAVEPEPRQYIELEDNINEFNLFKIRPFRLALSDKNDRAWLKIQGRGGHVLDREKTDNSVLVKTRTLNTFLSENNINSVDILKIDIESAENLVFSGLDIDKAMKKVKFICGEHGDAELIERHGFTVEKTTGQGWIAKRT